MKRLETFFASLFRSMSDPTYYPDILKAKLSFSFKYFFGLTCIISFILTIFISFRFLLPLHQLLIPLPQKIVDLFPDELTITIKDGILSTNIEEPYYVPLDMVRKLLNNIEKPVLGVSTELPVYLVVIDTLATIEDYEDYGTFFLVTQKHLIYQNENGNIEIIPFSEMNNFVLHKGVVAAYADAAKPWVSKIVPVLIPFVFLTLWWGSFLWYLVYLLPVSLISFLIAKLIGLSLPYPKLYQLMLHLLTAPLLIFSILGMVDLYPMLPFFFTLIVLLLTVYVLLQLKEMKTLSLPVGTRINHHHQNSHQ